MTRGRRDGGWKTEDSRRKTECGRHRDSDAKTLTVSVSNVPGVIHMIQRELRYLTVLVLVVSLLAFCSCSKAKEAQKEGKDTKSAAQQATESIRDLGKKPIDKARETQKLGDDRTKAIDEAVGGLNRE